MEENKTAKQLTLVKKLIVTYCGGNSQLLE